MFFIYIQIHHMNIHVWIQFNRKMHNWGTCSPFLLHYIY